MKDRLSLTLSLKEDSIYVGQKVIEILGNPRQIQMMMNEEQKKLLIQACVYFGRKATRASQAKYTGSGFFLFLECLWSTCGMGWVLNVA